MDDRNRGPNRIEARPLTHRDLPGVADWICRKIGELVESAKRRAMEPPIELQITDADGRNLYDVEIREDGKAYDLGYDLPLREAKFPGISVLVLMPELHYPGEAVSLNRDRLGYGSYLIHGDDVGIEQKQIGLR